MFDQKISLNKSQLQLIAVLAMLIDHIAWGFVEFWSPLGQIMHVIGRLTIPIMCFFIAEGFRRTGDLRRYFGRLAVFYVASIVPFYLFFRAEYGYRQNILLDHLTSLLILTVLERKSLQKWQKVVLLTLIFAISMVICGWPITPALFTLAFYYGRTFKEKAKWFIWINVATVAFTSIFSQINQVLGFAAYDWTWYNRVYLLGFMLALPLLSCYNREKGRLLLGNHLLYWIYPVHLLILSFLRVIADGEATPYRVYLWFHIVSLIVILVMLIGVLQARPSRMQSALLMFLVLESFYIVGFITEIMATTLEALYVSCVVEYFGELLMLVAFMIFASECGRIRIPRFIYIAHVTAALALDYAVLSTRETGFFYKEILLTTIDGHTKGIYVHGTGYYLSSVYLLVVIVEMLFIMINSLVKGTGIEKRRVAMLLGAVMFIWIPYAITLTGITKGYEVPVVGVVGAGILLTVCLYRYGALDSVAIVSESALAKAGEGMIIIDDRLLVTFSNALARAIVRRDHLKGSNAGKNETLQSILQGKLTEIVYGSRTYEVKVEELKHGAYIQGYTIWFLDETRNRELLNEATHLANHDALTGLYNRRHFENLVMEEILHKKPGTLVIVDMDNFKAVNDTYGHDKGDSVLIAFARIPQAFPEEMLYSCRIGGDEFTIYFRGMTDRLQIEDLIGTIMQDFRQAFEADEVRSTLSIGVAINDDLGDWMDFNAMYKAADRKLYIAKGRGKNCYEI